MKSELVYRERKYFTDGSFYEVKIWSVPESEDKPYELKYSFVYIVNNERVIGYDNHEHKEDHRHIKDKEYPYRFQSLEKLWKDFINDINLFREGKV